MVAAVAIWVYRSRGQIWGLTIAAGVFTHLVLDEMWRLPEILLWPAFGFDFQKIMLDLSLAGIFRELFSAPRVYISELIGLVIIAWFGVTLLRSRGVGAFLRHGRVQ